MAYTTIDKHKSHFNTILYDGNGSLPRAITGVGHSPDLVWAKDRDTAYNPQWHDSVRGIDEGAIYSNATNGNDTTYHMDSFDTDGFTMGTDLDAINGSGKKIVAWNWLAGGKAPTQTYKVVVVSDSGNKYRFRNSTDTATFGASAVTLDLQEGGTYTFDVSDSTMNSHPFVIGTAANSSEYSTGVTYKLDGVTKTYSQYTSGFSSATSRQLIITVAASAPALYYWCSVHSGMGGAINTNASHGSSNFDGSIQTLVSANTTAGFSIVKWSNSGSSAATIGHGLGAVPATIFTKKVSASGDNWHVGHHKLDSSPWGDYVILNNTSGKSTATNIWNDTAPTSTVFSTGNHGTFTGGSVTMAYCFAEKQGYSRFGKITALGNNDNAFEFTGFAPQFVMIKPIVNDSWSNFYIFDNIRDSNLNDKPLYANLSTKEAYYGGSPATNYAQIDILSNGFKIRRDGSWGGGGDGQDSLYWAWGQSIVGSNNVPATAR